jgi:putative spermidine/putrescine transport system ATP-binding protein
MTHLVLDKLNLAYGKSAAVTDLNLSVAQGQLISLLGPSGCGKTTTMRAVAGLLRPVSGRIVLAGEDITQRPVHQRDMGLVFQSYALFPHLSAYDNVAFGLRLRKVAAAELDQRVRSAIASVGLQGFESRLPANLSGGQQQRVAVARAIVLRPRLLLLDEPLSNLDALLRVEMRAELRRIQRELGITMLYVTHDPEEALSLSDRIVVMRDGRIEQTTAPGRLPPPGPPFVATFAGYREPVRLARRRAVCWRRPQPLAVQRPARHGWQRAWRWAPRAAAR